MNDVFSSWCRRAILYYLQDHEDPVAVTAVTRQLIVWQRDEVPHPEQEAALVEWLRPRLLQHHIVEMDEFGILNYDPDSDRVWIPDTVTITVSPP